MKNATFLFEEPSRNFKNSECRWTAIAQICFFYLSSKKLNSALSIYNSDPEGYLTKNGELKISDFNYMNTVCEQRLAGSLFDINDFENQFLHICPDITRLNVMEKKVTFIEVKTLSESVLRNLELYTSFVDYLKSKRWKCTLLYLLSHGHEIQKDWKALSSIKSKIIIWEDLFTIMKDTPLSFLFGDSLHKFCEPPHRRK